MTDFVTRLAGRGMLHQCTDEAALRAHLASGVRTAYVGYDPTADSLTIGNLVTIMLLRHWQESGHTPLVLMGGGTGLIGDPSGKTAERELLTGDKVHANVESQKRIFSRLLDFSGPRAAKMHNNADWLVKLGYIQVLRDVGKHFSVNQMVQRDSVKKRLEEREQGISYTEFSYMILQAYDFLHLHKHHAVTLQMGGSDQWGNIVSGCDLIRRDESANSRHAAEAAASIAEFSLSAHTDVETLSALQMVGDIAQSVASGGGGGGGVSFGLTTPLVTKADGGKFGKTESGAIWLTAERTSPYAYYQFWLNAADADAERFLKVFTLLPVEQIAATMAEQAANPGARAAQRLLAREATDLLHGKAEREKAEAAAAALFSGDVSVLDERTLAEALGAVPSSDHSRSSLDGQGVTAIDVLVEAKVCKSKTEARQALAEGSVSANGKKLAVDSRLTAADLLHGKIIALRRGRKNWFVTRWV